MTKIYLTQGASGFVFPISPAEIQEESNQKLTTYDTAAQGQILHIGRVQLRAWSWSSFFPVKSVPWAVDQSMKGMQYVRQIQAMQAKREPLRLTVPALGISADVAIASFTYSQKKGVDIYYTIKLSEYRGWV